MFLATGHGSKGRGRGRAYASSAFRRDRVFAVFTIYFWCNARRFLLQQIKEVQAKIRTLATASKRLFQISVLHDGIHSAHETLNTFWGRMFNDARQLQTIDDQFNAFGAQLLLGSQSFTIPAAKQSVDSVSTLAAFARPDIFYLISSDGNLRQSTCRF